MKKPSKLIAVLICAAMMLALIPQAGLAAGKTVTVTVADFDVFLNGVMMDSRNSEYPLIVFRNITYVPMTWNLTRFMGLKTRYDKKNGENIFFVGNTADRAYVLEEDKASTRNKGSYSAYITDYRLAVNDTRHFIDNKTEQYPILTFREITYFPLTWRFAHDCFGWDYYYDNENGLAIDSRNAFRPEWNEDVIWAGTTSGDSVYYACNDNAYVGWRETDTRYNGGILIWGRRNMDEITVDLTDQLDRLNITCLNSQFRQGTESSAQPRINGNNFYIRALAAETGGKYRTYDLTVDLAAGKITGVTEVTFDSRGNVTGSVTPLDGWLIDPDGEIPSLDGDETDGSIDLGSGDGSIDLGGDSDGSIDPDGDNKGSIDLDGDSGKGSIDI